MKYVLLNPPSYLMAENQVFASPVRGLKAAGPYDRDGCPKQPRLLFVFPEEQKAMANRLFLALRNGLGPFSGMQSWFGITLSADSMARLKPFDVNGLDDKQAADRYLSQINHFLEGNHGQVDAALVIHRRTSKLTSNNPYLICKYSLLRAGIPTQVVTSDILDDARTFQWSVGNIACALFAKMGGMPWAIQSRLSDDTLIVGLNRAFVWDPTNPKKTRYYGFATAFSYHGLYLGLQIFPAASQRETYISQLRSSVAAALTTWHAAIGKKLNLVLHIPKDPKRDEEGALNNAVVDAGYDKVHSWSIVRINRAEHVRVMDPSATNAAPPSGVLVSMDRSRYLLQLSGRDDKVIGADTTSCPWSIRIISQSGSAPSAKELCEHIFALSGMNWRGLNANAVPVSVEYPRQIAELMARFSEAGFQMNDISNLEVLKRPWFL